MRVKGFRPSSIPALARTVSAPRARLLPTTLLALLLMLVPAVPFAAASSGQSPAAQAIFNPPVTWPAGMQPVAIAVGDVDNDGIADIVATSLRNSVTVLRGAGRGQFGSPTEYGLGRRPTAVKLADLNGDGNLDVITVSFNQEGMHVLYNDGAGGFHNPLLWEVGPGTGEPGSAGPSDVVAADFSGDGTVDVATANSISQDISYFYKDSSEELSWPVNVSVPGRPSVMQVADFDGDNRPDIAVAAGTSVILLLNSTSSPSSVGQFANTAGLAIGDFDRDGNDDFVTVARNSVSDPYTVRTFRGQGNGVSFSVFDSTLNNGTEAPASLAVGDVTGDGPLDLVAIYGQSNKAVILRNLGDGRFDEFASLDINAGASGSLLHDMDGDGTLDLLIGTTDGVQVFQGGVSGSINRIDSDSLELWLEAGVFTSDRSVLADRSRNLNNGKSYNFADANYGYNTSSEPPVRAWITFDGVDDYIGTEDRLRTPHVMTMAVWFRTTTPAGKLAGFESSVTSLGSQYDRHLYLDTAGHLRFGAYNGISENLRTQQPVTDGQWHHAVATLDLVGESAEMALYLDGQLQGTAVASQFVSYEGYWRVGGGQHNNWPGWGFNNFFKGDIGSLRIYSAAASQAEVSLLFDNTAAQVLPTPTSGGAMPDPIAWLNAGRRGSEPYILTDLSGHSNHGILNNFEDIEAAFGGDGAQPVPRYITFDGVDDFISTNTLMEAPVSFSVAVRFRTTEATGKIVGFHSSVTGISNDFDRHIYIDTDGRLRFGVARAGENLHLTSMLSRDPVTDGEWHLAVGTVQRSGTRVFIQLYLDGEPQAGSDIEPIRNYFGYWRIGGGDIGFWPSLAGEYFNGDISEFALYDVALSAEQVAILSGIARPTPAATPTTTAPRQERDPQPTVRVSHEIDGETLTLSINLSNIPSPTQSAVYVVREDGAEFAVGPAVDSELEWTGTAMTARYRVEVRQAGAADSFSVVAQSTVPVLVPIATPREIGVAVGVGVAAAAAGSAAAASGFSLYDLIMRVGKIFLTEQLRRRTRKIDFKRIPSWVAAVVALALMAILLTIGKPGALQSRGFGEAFAVAGAASVMFRGFTLAGGVFLALITGQKPRYLLWAAGTVSFAVTSIGLHAPFGYTGYMDRKPGNPHRDARFAVAGFSVMFTLAGVFMLIGTMTQVAFAETGITLVFGVLAATMLPFPLMGGHALWKVRKIFGLASGVVGLIPYALFLYGMLPVNAIYALAVFGFLIFASIMIGDLWIGDQEKQKAKESGTTDASATAAVASAEAVPVPPAAATLPIAPTVQNEIATPQVETEEELETPAAEPAGEETRADATTLPIVPAVQNEITASQVVEESATTPAEPADEEKKA